MDQHPKDQLHDNFGSPADILHACIRDGNIPQLRNLLNASPGPNLSYCHPVFGPPLHFAAWCGELDAIELLLAAGADPLVASKTRSGLTPIGYAAREGHRYVVERLWKCFPPDDQVRGLTDRQSPLCIAASKGYAVIVDDLLTWWDGWSYGQKCKALAGAAMTWQFDAVASLLMKGSFDQVMIQRALDVTIDDRFLLRGEEATHFEGYDYFNQQQLIELLIDAGADPNKYIHSGGFPLICKAACNANLTGALKTLLERGAAPNITSSNGESALRILASPVPVGQASTGREVMNEIAIRLLLQYNASVSELNKKGESPLHLAAYGSDLHIFRLYLSSSTAGEENALLALTNPDQETLLHYAAAGCRVDILEYLISQGLDVNAKSSNGWTPLICALTPTYRYTFGKQAIKSLPQAIQAALTLLSHGADPSIATDEALTSLHALALHCDIDVRGKAAELTKELISRGVNPAARAPLLTPINTSYPNERYMPWSYRLRDAMIDPSASQLFIQPNLTPLHWAAQRGAVGVVRALLAEGVSVSSTDAGGNSPVSMAIESKALLKRTDVVDTIFDLLVEAGASC